MVSKHKREFTTAGTLESPGLEKADTMGTEAGTNMWEITVPGMVEVNDDSGKAAGFTTTGFLMDNLSHTDFGLGKVTAGPIKGEVVGAVKPGLE